MLELNTTLNSTAPNNPVDLITDGSEATFMQEVIEASQTTPIIVDFWAPWCGPCKTLGPMLEAAVTAANGAVKMVKIDIDQNQGLAAQLRIQSVPTVYAFYQGQPVDGFQGALPGSEINDFVTRVAAMGGGAPDNGLADAIAAAEDMLEQGAAADAVETFAAVLGEEPENPAAYGGLVRAYLAMDDVDTAEATLNGAPAEIATSPELEAAFAQVQLARQAQNAGPLAELQAAAEANPDDHHAHLDLATAQQAAGDTQGAVDTLLALFGRAPDWNDGAARAQLFTIFDALPANDPIVLAGRRKLSSLIFA